VTRGARTPRGKPRGIHPEGVRPEVRSAPENDWSGYEPESYTRGMTVTACLLLAGPR
jgi:hypothetical protein